MTRTREDVSEELCLPDEALFLDDYDDCIIGALDSFQAQGVVVYDLKKVIGKLKLGGLTEAEAFEYWHVNMVGAYVGEMTPVYITLLEEENARPQQEGDGRDVQR